MEIEDLAAFFRGWPVEAIQLGPRVERTVVTCNAFRSHRILRLEAGSELALHGAVHKTCSCAMLSASPEPEPRLAGEPMRVTDVVLAGAGARLNLFVPIAAIVFILIAPLSAFMSLRALRTCHERDAQGLAQYIKQHRMNSDTPLAGQLRDAVASSKAMSIANSRVSAVMSASRLIERHLPSALSLDELSRHCGVSARTLQHGFREVYGTTPRSFARSLRLTRSRMALQRAKRYTPINEIASAFGYEQIGQYSRDYRRWFGETPSMTLARV